jgi:hypothetical protein
MRERAERKAAERERPIVPLVVPFVALPAHVGRAVAPVLRALVNLPRAELVGREVLILPAGSGVLQIGPVTRDEAIRVLRASGLADIAEQLAPIAGDRMRLVHIDESDEAHLVGVRLASNLDELLEVAG